VETLTPEQKLAAVEAWEECDHWLQAQKQTPLASLAESPTHADERWCNWEIASSLRISDAAAADRIRTALALTSLMEDSLDELEDGRITYVQARLIAEGSVGLSHEDAARVQAKVLARAPKQTRTETRQAVERAVMAVDPEAAEERRRRRRRERRIERPRPVGDGQSAMWIEGPTETVVAIFLILSGWSKQMKKTGQVDTVGAGRFDALVGLIFAMAAGDLIARMHPRHGASNSDSDERLYGVVPPPWD
jgi:hypothetical protein